MHRRVSAGIAGQQLAEHLTFAKRRAASRPGKPWCSTVRLLDVVAGVNLNRLDGLGSLERVRDSKLAIKSLPFSGGFQFVRRRHLFASAG